MYNINWIDLSIASSLVCISIFISFMMKLGLAKKTLIAAIRTIVQLSAIGFILKYIFSTDHPLWVVIIILIMTMIAGLSAAARSQYTYRGQKIDSLISVWITAWIVAIIGLYIVLHIHPWYSPQYIIPIIGMILGNSLNAVSLTFHRITQLLAQDKPQIEMLLAMGATPWEAFRQCAKQAVTAGMLPSINNMSVVGIVSLPGMMTGQILAGGDPEQAVRYQIVILFLMCAAASMGSILAVVLVYRRFFTPQAIFKSDKLILQKD
ncbi:ABC transporter permease [Basilea psittacipulmonis]|uniref:ABC transporter permease n=1 Tax=Basilea psittacipulmonis DSM 24701 TaxID=1072685 RepID=A0A077DFY2_9BURK|nr:iron export ABC transporter permease subunit FetB [Basilea psittacipulmonis]AIL32083.1 ABC transporter permease [Basilea psittacipulmonis DSM 24701]